MKGCDSMEKKEQNKLRNVYDDDNIPEVDLPHGSKAKNASVEPLPESTRPRQDGPGGSGN